MSLASYAAVHFFVSIGYICAPFPIRTIPRCFPAVTHHRNRQHNSFIIAPYRPGDPTPTPALSLPSGPQTDTKYFI